MSQKKKVVVTTKKTTTTKKKATPTTSRLKGERRPKRTEPSALIFDRNNYIWMIAGFGCVILGLLLMTGGRMSDPNEWDPNVIYSFRRIGLAPLFILAGLGMEIYAIFKK